MSAALRITSGVSLRSLNTFGVEAQAALLVELHNETGLDSAIRACGPNGPELILGGGSNLLLTRSIDGAVLRLDSSGIEVIQADDRRVEIEVAGGTPWHELVLWTLGHGLQGLENLALIPGTVGAAPIQNIGAYGVELADCLSGLSAVDLASGERRTFLPQECGLAYRNSIFKSPGYASWLILRVRFRLTRSGKPNADYGELRAELAGRHIDAPDARQVAEAVIRIRARKLPDPRTLGNAGSFFKNPIVTRAVLNELRAAHPEMPSYPVDATTVASRSPFATAGNRATDAAPVKLSAAWLIERCGWKGRRVGDAGVYAGHSLILVNHGSATGLQLLELAMRISESVEKRFGVRLEIEPRVI